MTQENRRPYVIALDGVTARGSKSYAVVAGVVLAIDEHDAFCQAQARWPEYVILQPEPWEKVPVRIRLAAIKQDC